MGRPLTVYITTIIVIPKFCLFNVFIANSKTFSGKNFLTYSIHDCCLNSHSKQSSDPQCKHFPFFVWSAALMTPPRVLARNMLASGLREDGVRLAGGAGPLLSPGRGREGEKGKETKKEKNR